VEKILDINVKSPVLLAKAAVPHMPRGGSIVFVSSYTAFNPAPPIAMYAVSKTALLGLTKALAEELGPDGITVNCLAPGIVPTKASSWRGGGVRHVAGLFTCTPCSPLALHGCMFVHQEALCGG
jgi:NAD(P)-dependent dehydrogenase (short-subunit alcohol dehydrogenase family)